MNFRTISPSTVMLLLKPEVYPHAVSELKLLETHISWVILTGDFAYKLKKPCQYSFVDYSTLKLRQEFCWKELEYNRRLAADLYLDVVPIYASGEGTFRFGSSSHSNTNESDPIEYAVKMKQFPQDAILTAQVDHHELLASSVDRFGVDVAGFHEGIEHVNPDRACVAVGRLRQDAIENIETLNQSLPPDSHLRPALDSLLPWTENEFARLESTFQARLDEGFVRRCHGDMHLNNLIQLDGKVMAFDCIEFNEEFQWIDVMSDVAFPVMDFMAKGRNDLSWRMLNAYLETREDWHGLEVFRFYAVYRAMVRAKVTWLDPSKHHSTNVQEAVERATNPWEVYIRTAHAISFPPASRLAFTYGLSGSGKSTKAMEFVSHYGALRIRSDIERHRTALADSGNPYSPASREAVYEHAFHWAEQLLSLNYSVVVDATFLKAPWRKKFQALASKRQVSFHILACEASVEELERRIMLRHGDASEANIAVLHQQLAENDPLSDAERACVLKL